MSMGASHASAGVTNGKGNKIGNGNVTTSMNGPGTRVATTITGMNTR